MACDPHCSSLPSLLLPNVSYNNKLIAVMISSTSSRISRKSHSRPPPPPLAETLRRLQGEVRQLREESRAVREWAGELGSGAGAALGEWAGKLGHLVFRQAREKLHLEG